MSSDNGLAVVLEKKEALVVKANESTYPVLPSRFVKVQVKSTGICGSDVHYLKHGAIGEFVVKSPMILGHESSGSIVEVAEDVKFRRVGQRVAIEPGVPCRNCSYCREGMYNLCKEMRFAATPPIDGTLQKYYLVPEDFVKPVPDNMSFDEAALMEPLSVAVHVVKRLNITFASNMVIFGAGAIGLLCAAVARARGVANILLIDANASRLKFAESYIKGAQTYLPPPMQKDETKMDYSKRNAAKILSEHAWLEQFEGAHCVVEATGAEVCTQTGLLVTRKNGVFLQAGMGQDTAVLPIATICAREITVLGSFRYNEGCYEQAISLVERGLVDVRALITHTFAFEDAAKAFDTTAAAAEGTVKTHCRSRSDWIRLCHNDQLQQATATSCMDPERREKERAKRLARLAAASPSSPSSDQEAIARPEKRHHVETSSPIPTTARAPAQSQPVERSTPVQKTEQLVKQERVKAPVVEQSIEEWISTIISNVLKITLDPTQEAKYYLATLHEELSEEMESSQESPSLNLDTLDRAILCRLADELPTSPFEYLLGAYKQCNEIMRVQRKSMAEQRVAAIDEIKRLCVSYASLSITMPELLGAMHQQADLISLLLREESDSRGMPGDFMADLVKKNAEDDALAEFFEPLFNDLSSSVGRLRLTANFYRHFAVLRMLLQHSQLAQLFVTLPKFFDSGNSPADMEHVSLLGPFFKLSPIDAVVAQTTFANMSGSNPAQLNNAISSLRSTLPVLQAQLFTICNLLVRHSGETRMALLRYFAKAVNLNRKRHAIQVDPTTVSSDGFMVNITAVLNQFAEPFVSDTNKIDRIDVAYLRRDSLIELEDETRLAADRQATTEYYAKREEGESNFISHIFFLNVAYHHYGLGATMATHEKMLQRMRDLEKYHAEMQSQQPFQGPQAMMMVAQFQRIEASLARVREIFYTYETVLCDEASQARSFSFLTLVASWLIRLVDRKGAYPKQLVALPLVDLAEADAYRNLPEYFVEDIAEFFVYVSRFTPKLLASSTNTELVIFSLVFLKSSNFIKNPYLKAKLVEVLYNGSRPLRHGDTQGALGGILHSHEFALQHLFPTLMSFYIEVESTGLSSQFYDKFNIRYHISQIFKTIWDNPAHRKKLEDEFKTNIDLFVRFVALLLNDQTYLLDEALAKLAEIHKLQHELQGADATTPETQEQQTHLSQSERSATSYLQLGTETLSMLNLFTASIPSAFCTAEIVDRLAAMLDYNLDALVGPKCTGLKVQNPEKYHFDPKALLNGIIGIFLNMTGQPIFITAVAKDGRSYKRDNFERARGILSKFALRSSTDLDTLAGFVVQVEACKAELEQNEEDLGEVPDEFLDPLMGEIMVDPVILPASKTVIDRGTIKRHLLNDATDPFNRTPLKLEDVIPADDVRAAIEAFRASKKRG
ncbi:ubiquitin elongating factor core-domain-containing protein [Protomyces lactucae-debilis]|uniref:RING-type E3 ubiquitin transferase n=1 Tax=Protomyces lactucae-debilis TaxID=2754530 RepID=A0A1Y2F1S3_PROLT|nr:ubiquitin elongating factor core-domain-containing protein [Protomyces lactucae-debilis]ORY77296.1 ubiquitin elongating factor core-domain-containing protein [Protomyces lactucae-debilis]